MKKLGISLSICIFLSSCNSGAKTNVKPEKDPYDIKPATDAENPSYDPRRGEGKFKKVEIAANLNPALAADGEKVYGVKCSSCHKTTSEKLVGPGWLGVTKKLTAEWIMNFATNPDAMIDKDPEAKAQLEICLVRMPNQNLSDTAARAVYEYMRKNDGVK